MTPFESILWRRLDRAGHEYACVSAASDCRRLTGTAVIEHDGRPCSLRYEIECDSQWRTLSGWVSGRIGGQAVDIDIAVESGGVWRLNGAASPGVSGCTDLDLNFSPSTNLLPIKRLGLAIGEDARVRAGWLRFPSFALEPLDQVYRRIGETTYHYESGGGRFSAELEINKAGFVIRYPNFCEAVTSYR